MTKRRTGVGLASRSTLTAGTRADRMRSRLQLDSLSSLRIIKKTERRYVIACGRFCFFTLVEGWLPLCALLLIDPWPAGRRASL